MLVTTMQFFFPPWFVYNDNMAQCPLVNSQVSAVSMLSQLTAVCVFMCLQVIQFLHVYQKSNYFFK